jgi:non-ribosomal peptide synthetase component F
MRINRNELEARKLSISDELDATICTDNLLWRSLQTPSSIIYTSGFNRRAQGRAEDHKYILRIVRAYSEDVDISLNDKLILLFSLTSNGSRKSLWRFAQRGDHLLPGPKNGNTARLATWLRQERITIYYSSVSVFETSLRPFKTAKCFRTFRIVQLSAEPVLLSDVELCRRHFASKCIFINRFGTTESWSFSAIPSGACESFPGSVAHRLSHKRNAGLPC